LAISRAKKEELVELYQKHSEEAGAIIFTDYRGSTVSELQNLREKLKNTGATYMVVKNRLLKIALEKRTSAEELFEGPKAVLFSGEDIGSGVKALKDWIKTSSSVEIKGAVLESSTLDADGASALADLPTKEQTLAMILGTINAPASSLARIVNEPGASLARVLQARADQLQEAG